MICPQTLQNCQQRAFRLAFRITRNQEDAEDAEQEAAHHGADCVAARLGFYRKPIFDFPPLQLKAQSLPASIALKETQ